MGDFSGYFISGNIRVTKSALITDNQGVHGGDADAWILAHIELRDIKICNFAVASNGLLRPYEARIPVDRNYGGIDHF